MTVYFAQICKKHDQMEGKRYRYANGHTACAGCVADRVQAWRDAHPLLRKFRAARQHTKAGREANAAHSRMSRIGRRVCREMPDAVEHWNQVRKQALEIKNLGLREHFLRGEYLKLRQQYHVWTPDQQRQLDAHLQKKLMTDPEYLKEYTRRVTELHEETSHSNSNGSVLYKALWWRDFYADLAKEVGLVVESGLSDLTDPGTNHAAQEGYTDT